MLFQNLEIWNNEGKAFFAIRNYAFFGVPLVCQLSETQLTSAAQRNKVELEILNKSASADTQPNASELMLRDS